jgi:phosphatidylglycerophosphatase A
MSTQTTDNKALLAVAGVETETASATVVVAAAVAVETRVADKVVADNQTAVVDEVVAAAADVAVGELAIWR